MVQNSLPQLVYGLDGLASILGISKATAYRWNKTGKFNGASYRLGKKLIFDTNKVLKSIEQ